MFYTIEDLVLQSKNYASIAEMMIAVECENSGRTREQVIALMDKNLTVMEQSVAEGRCWSDLCDGINRWRCHTNE